MWLSTVHITHFHRQVLVLVPGIPANFDAWLTILQSRNSRCCCFCHCLLCHHSSSGWIHYALSTSMLEPLPGCPSFLSNIIESHSSMHICLWSLMIIQFHTAGEIPVEAFNRHDVIYGRVEKITDGDTFRVRWVEGGVWKLFSIMVPIVAEDGMLSNEKIYSQTLSILSSVHRETIRWSPIRQYHCRSRVWSWLSRNR